MTRAGAIEKALRNLMFQVRISDAVDDNGHPLTTLQALLNANTALAMPVEDAGAESEPVVWRWRFGPEENWAVSRKKPGYKATSENGWQIEPLYIARQDQRDAVIEEARHQTEAEAFEGLSVCSAGLPLRMSEEVCPHCGATADEGCKKAEPFPDGRTA